MEKTTLNPFENARRIAQGVGGGSVTPEQIEQLQSEIDVLGSENRTQTQDITDIKAQLTDLASAYSTTEHKTGRKWTDDKDIYEKVIDVSSLLGNNSDNSTDLTIDTLISIKGSASKTGTTIPLPYTASDVSNGVDFYVDTSLNKLHLLCRGNFTTYTSAKLVVQYTKPTV